MKTSPWFVLGWACGVVLGLTVLTLALFRLQIVQTDVYKEDQVLQVTRRVRMPGIRGRILDAQGGILATCRPSFGIRCTLETFQRTGSSEKIAARIDREVMRLESLLGVPRQVSFEQIKRHVRVASAVPLIVWRDLSEGALAHFCEHDEAFPGFEDFVQAERTYPQGTRAAHILGYTGRAHPEGGFSEAIYYSEKDLRGREGLERFYDLYLVGATGERREQVNARGFRAVGSSPELTREANDVQPTQGLDLTLTLDPILQSALERELEGTTGAGVILDPRSGAVRAMASSPTYDPNTCVPRLSFATFATLTNAPLKRGQNRAISEAYAPGSTFKPISALAALSSGWHADEAYNCKGVYRLGDLRLHCSSRWGHGPINLHEALEKSCNSYFCNIGTQLGTNALFEAARAFGLGAKTGIDLPGETPGIVPDNEWKKRTYREPWYPGDTCQMAIGQGMLLVTPLQMAVVAATLANGGRIYRPYLHTPSSRIPHVVRTLPFTSTHIDDVRQAMRDVAEKGTGKRLRTRLESDELNPFHKRVFKLNVSCAGKTGTAEIGRGETRRKNTWVIAFAPYENPVLALAMIIERGESGGLTVAPRVHAILADYFGETEEGSAL